jgi:hypothetical protein
MSDERSQSPVAPVVAANEKTGVGPGKRITVNLREVDVGRVDKLMFAHALSQTEVVRRALVTEEYFSEIVSSGSRLLIEDENGQQREIVMVR